MSRRETKEFHRMNSMEERAVPADVGPVGVPFSPDSLGRAEKHLPRKPLPRHEVHELADTSVMAEMDGGQRYHAYKPGR